MNSAPTCSGRERCPAAGGDPAPPRYVARGLAGEPPGPGTPGGSIDDSGLDARTHALVRLAARIAGGQCGASCDELVVTALDHGVTADEIAGLLVALLPAVDAVRVRNVAPGVLSTVARATAGSRPQPA
jgi:alkylhydroperoxidase/carboxymuconolactone decarboxylase family protein YurZ